ncbi:MAG: Asp-tRNA(Asn)/Glu-tRNA(Gln) amidotransferase subunit GatA [Gammaproteobacteria bacterium]|nr:Asp-tRNA(Asn)/Glu-tRNA(Gln) amidotransferase subunit GatA [Gammaproteobacteria bacterium]MDX2488653.1 Asp-tRNA(Asn)/Glu-tRNA(Gln) amidotransferase subunit GatA [Gammaproteobacteria bacterium]
MHNKSLRELALGLGNNDFSSVELTQYFLDRIEASKDINAFVTVDADTSLQQAAEADKILAAGKGQALTGIPLAHKDIFCTDGLRTSCGSRMLDNFIAPYDATVIQKFRQAGSVTLGKTNMDEFAMGSSNETSYYGRVLNPWDKNRVPGGSSGGSAAAVAAQLAPAATGTDTGGSIRQPASFCGLTGLKPSYGRVSRYGMIAFASSLDQAGPMTHSAEDAAIMLQTMSGFDERDSTSMDVSVPDFSADLGNDIQGMKIGMPVEFFNQDLDTGISSIVMDALGEYEKLGAELVEISLPNSHLSVPCYYVLAPAEASSNLSRFDGARYGYRTAEYDDLLDMYKNTRAEGFGEEVKRRIMIGTYALSAGYYDAYYLKAQKIRRLISDDFTRAFEQCDIIAGPTAPGTAFRFGEKSDDPVAMYLNDIYTISVNLAGLPGMSVPAGLDSQGLPVGLQLIGQYFDESKLLNAAYQYQQVTDWHMRCPEDV